MGRPACLLRVFPLALAIAAFASFLVISPLFAQDDHGNFFTGATPVTLSGAPFVGSINDLTSQADADYFSFHAQRGTLYTIKLDMTTVGDAYIEVINSVQSGARRSPDQKLTQINNSKTIEWVARTTDTYYVLVRAVPIPNATGYYLGDYVLRVSEDHSLTDQHSDIRDADSPTEIDPGNVYQGAVSPWPNQPTLSGVQGIGDVDYFSFSVVDGVRYTIKVDLGTSEGVAITLTRLDGTILKSSDGVDNTLTWISDFNIKVYLKITGTNRVPNSQGTYILRLHSEPELEDRGHPDISGQLTVANEIRFGNAYPGAISPEDDQDWFRFQAQRGVKYTITATLGTARGVELAIWENANMRLATNAGLGNTLEWVSPDTDAPLQHHFIAVSASTQVRDVIGTYTLSVTIDETLRDRHGDRKEADGRGKTPTEVITGSTNQGAISPADDVDFFYFAGNRGVTYSVRLNSASGESAAISIENAAGEALATNLGRAQELLWTALAGGTLYIKVSQSPYAANPLGAYAITVASDAALEDRYEDDKTRGNPISFGITYQGSINPTGDLDYFRFTAERGVEYTFELTYGSIDAMSLLVDRITGGSLATAVRNLGDAANLKWVPNVPGEYYLEVSASPRASTPIGTYTLRVIQDRVTVDRHSDNATGATPMGLRSAIAGAISPADDRDFFSFSAEGGETYTIFVTPGTLEGVRFSVEGVTIEFAASNFGSGNTLQWTAPASGSYRLSVAASDKVQDPIGTYQIAIYPAGSAPPVEPSQPATPPSVEDLSLPALVAGLRTGQVGTKVQVPVFLRRIQQVASLSFKLGYDPSVLEVTNIIPGSRFADATFIQNRDTPGEVSVGIAATKDSGRDGSVAVVEFQIIGDTGDVSPLTLSGVKLGVATGSVAEFPLVGGNLRVKAPTDGDGDGDGRVTAKDALIALKAAAASRGSPGYLWLDIDKDGVVTRADASLILAMARPG